MYFLKIWVAKIAKLIKKKNKKLFLIENELKLWIEFNKSILIKKKNSINKKKII